VAFSSSNSFACNDSDSNRRRRPPRRA
jgi:hypothetical protein